MARVTHDEELEAVLSDVMNENPSSLSHQPPGDNKGDEPEDIYIPVDTADNDNHYETKQPTSIELQAMPTTYADETADNILNFIIGKYYEFEFNGKIINLRLNSVDIHQKDTTSPNITLTTTQGESSKREPSKSESSKSIRYHEERRQTVAYIGQEEEKQHLLDLIPDSTNAWLFAEAHAQESTGDECNFKSCTDNAADVIIAIAVIILQLTAYLLMTGFLRDKRLAEYKSREESCYGPNCDVGYEDCIDMTTGGLMSVLLIGFLWADVVNTLSILFCGKGYKSISSCGTVKRWLASLLIICELITAIVCGFLVGLYSENDFDAIGGAVGILFVHDLDEKVFASMKVFRGTSCATFKKLFAVSLWIILSVAVSVICACKYQDGAYFNSSVQCKELEFECASDLTCIWEGFVCNGVEDCSDGSDEGILAGCIYQGGLNNDYCPDDKPFMCIEDGSCLEEIKKCNGIIDCRDGSDEGRAQNCSNVISHINCGELNITDLHPNDTYHKQWTGYFKCNNGQCIDAQHACDGQAGDCVDGSDEYPYFDKAYQSPFTRSCPYDKLVECEDWEILCKIDGQCISKYAICDGIKDCADGADEALCEYDCKASVIAYESFQCGGNIAVINSTNVITFFDENAANMTSVLHANTISYTKDKTDISHLFANVTSECIPIQWRCDGTNDCEDGSDEKLCSLLSCSDDEYQCSDSGACIPKSWLCDGAADCANGQDENSTVCTQNNVSASNFCIQQGYSYQCEDYPTICLDSDQICNGIYDCPYGDDEFNETCNVFNNNSTELFCNDIFEGYGIEWSNIKMSFTLPSQYTEVKFTTCLSANEGSVDIALHETLGVNGSYLYATPDNECGCSNRSTLLASVDNYSNTIPIWPITSDQSYTTWIYLGFTGNYAIQVECGNSRYALGSETTCVESGGSPEIAPTPPSSITDITACDQVLSGTLADGATEWFRFDVAAIQSGPIYVNGCSTNFDTVMEIYKESDLANYVARNDDDDTGTCTSNTYASYVKLAENSAYAGYYFLKFYPYSFGTGGSYSFTFGCGIGSSSNGGEFFQSTPTFNMTVP